MTSLKARRAGGYAAKNTLHCAEAVAKDEMPNTYPADLKEPISAFLQSLFDSGNAHEDTVFALVVEGYEPGKVALLVESLDEAGERTAQGKAQLELDTFAALNDPRIEVILGGRFGPVFEKALAAARGEAREEYDPWRISQPDIVLVVRDEAGRAVELIPVDVKDHKALGGNTKGKDWLVSDLSDLGNCQVRVCGGSPKLDDFMQLAHYYRHFEQLSLAGEAKGAIVGREMRATWMGLDVPAFTGGEGGRTKRSALDIYDQWDAQNRLVVDNAQKRDVDPSVPAITIPELKPACKECAWKLVCEDELAAHPGGGHITLLPGITPLKAKPHYDAGVDSVLDLARLDLVTAAAVEADEVGLLDNPDPVTAAYAGTGVKDLVKAILQARATAAGKVARVPGVERVDLKRADVEIDFDLENSSGPVLEGAAHPGGELVYLWGTRQATRRTKRDGTVVTTVKVRLFSDFTDTAAGEAATFAKFWNFLTSSRSQTLAQGKTWRAYHYTAHETGWMRKLANRYAGQEGIPSLHEVDEFLSTGDVVDLYQILSRELIWPTKSHSIKDLAKWARFSWRASDAGGDNSMLWYANAVSSKTKKERTAYQRKVLNYNTDDVAAQHHLREWITALEAAEDPGHRIPAAEKLRKPAASRK